jgi:hypothetical protein
VPCTTKLAEVRKVLVGTVAKERGQLNVERLGGSNIRERGETWRQQRSRTWRDLAAASFANVQKLGNSTHPRTCGVETVHE